jgi:hypothetical protein
MIVRCSSLGKLMTDPRTKSEVLSETAKTYIQDVFKEKELGIYKDFQVHVIRTKEYKWKTKQYNLLLKFLNGSL